ncbi:sulfotransferase [Aureococcus anophagefferens]|nr:sulfotransferase [Aureococcus anophagefferens]
MICHQLRTGGDLNFDDIYQVAPWPPLSWDLGIDCDADQVAAPRLFKTHQRLSAQPRGGRYLCTVRDPATTILSWWHFLGPAGKDIPPLRKYANASQFCRDERFVVENMRFGAALWDYYVEFWECRHLENVHFDESWTYRRLVDVGRMGDPSSYVPSDRVRAATAATAALDADAVAFLDRQWAERVAPRTGHPTYADFAAALPR